MLELTGERIIPDLMKPMNGMLLEHIARYYFAMPYVHGRVLDIASGVGYGSFMIAKTAKKDITEVVGVDIDKNTVEYAKKHYYHQKVTYQIGDALDQELPSRLGGFDVIISFETIEHVPDEKRFLDNLYAMLKPGGTIIISSPFGQGKGKPTNELFHFHQFTKEEFINLFNDFSDMDLFFQRGVTFEYSQDKKVPREGVNYPLGIAVCKK